MGAGDYTGVTEHCEITPHLSKVRLISLELLFIRPGLGIVHVSRGKRVCTDQMRVDSSNVDMVANLMRLARMLQRQAQFDTSIWAQARIYQKLLPPSQIPMFWYIVEAIVFWGKHQIVTLHSRKQCFGWEDHGFERSG